MNNGSDFFGNVFDDPEDDPLLSGDDEEARGSSPQSDQEAGAPSWVTNEEGGDTAPAGRSQGRREERNSDSACERKTIVVDQRDDDARGLTELNEAVGQGWRLVRISLDRPSGQQAASRTEAERFVAVLEQESPQSLFDFGAQ
jgi:hypothetical protein